MPEVIVSKKNIIFAARLKKVLIMFDLKNKKVPCKTKV
jgi:hypothetical protein